MDTPSVKLNIPQITSHVEDASTPKANKKVFKFIQVPDYTGAGIIHVKVKNYNTTNVSIMLYCLEDNHDTNMTLTYTTTIPCTTARHYRYTPTQMTCAAYYAILVHNQQSYPATLPASNIMSFPGYMVFAASGPYTPPDVVTSVNTGVKSWVTSQQDSSLKRLTTGDDPQLPSLTQTISELKTSGVPANFFTTDVTNNLQILLNQYNDSFTQLKAAVKANGPHATIATKHDQSVSWGCWWCQVGFGIIITLLTCAITVALLALIPTGFGAAAAGGIAAYLVVWFDLAAATASTVATGLISTVVTVGSVSIGTILLNLPNLICEAIGTCK
ncbi:hypothetical protein PPL_10714 [Heterostelium album PN500]|uniref:Uncharacterized protein n=1 Tax=Heterostelium pallidum (strain ATCC 26659 / Pp 5 / PN500) TaxID=670386 RepID=D3BRV2_HETP5|nr:hypothetical protein PPL_10714 [Heterostelium album PN500]EFA76134.1 hypothetical protein PPL_10714 [Heterostelium album PN500]|eukprot:XP_020428268.1 hypothetical protein PPL_10714 [Heterostelium album PN500]